ncbi:hypothetical protein [Spirosoma sp. KNUC1025]
MESILDEPDIIPNKLQSPYDVTDDVAGLKTLFVNVFLSANPAKVTPGCW